MAKGSSTAVDTRRVKSSAMVSKFEFCMCLEILIGRSVEFADPGEMEHLVVEAAAAGSGLFGSASSLQRCMSPSKERLDAKEDE